MDSYIILLFYLSLYMYKKNNNIHVSLYSYYLNNILLYILQDSEMAHNPRRLDQCKDNNVDMVGHVRCDAMKRERNKKWMTNMRLRRLRG